MEKTKTIITNYNELSEYDAISKYIDDERLDYARTYNFIIAHKDGISDVLLTIQKDGKWSCSSYPLETEDL